MSDTYVHLVRLVCTQCNCAEVHQFRYAGRLLSSCQCTRCGYRISKSATGLRRAYLRDATHRIITKPARMWRRTTRDPHYYVLGLPGSFFAKPARLKAEWRALRDVERDKPPD